MESLVGHLCVPLKTSHRLNVITIRLQNYIKFPKRARSLDYNE